MSFLFVFSCSRRTMRKQKKGGQEKVRQGKDTGAFVNHRALHSSKSKGGDHVTVKAALRLAPAWKGPGARGGLSSHWLRP